MSWKAIAAVIRQQSTAVSISTTVKVVLPSFWTGLSKISSRGSIGASGFSVVDMGIAASRKSRVRARRSVEAERARSR